MAPVHLIKILLSGLLIFAQTALSIAQNNPAWNNPLLISTSFDGDTFNTPTVFQDSSGVPCVIKWKGDTLVAVFQWFRKPIPSPTWDKVAVKFSYNAGTTWSQPVPITITGLPLNYQRPFDPSLTVINPDSLRIYFSSSVGMPVGGLDSTVNTYSAVSVDGINYFFEPDARVDVLSNRVIDPSVCFFNSSWHYVSPIGASQQGAYHYVSPDGITFMPVPSIPSDMFHNWTGNYMIENSSELRFYGCGSTVWYNSTVNGGVWNGFVNTNIQGGDPSVVKISSNSYVMIYVGQPYPSAIQSNDAPSHFICVFPNPVNGFANIKVNNTVSETDFTISDFSGKLVFSGKLEAQSATVDMKDALPGLYCLRLGQKCRQVFVVN